MAAVDTRIAPSPAEHERTLFSELLDPCCIVEVVFDSSGTSAVDYRFLEVNASFRAHTGLSNPVGQTGRMLEPEHDASWYALCGRVALTGVSERFERHDRASERWFEGQVLRVGSAAERRVAVLFRDVTARREAEARRDISEATLRALFESPSLLKGVVEILDDDSDIIHISDTPGIPRFLGLSPGSITYRRASALGVPRAILDAWIRSYRESQLERKEVRFEYEHPASDGPRWFSVMVSYLCPGLSGRSRFAYVIEDRTEARRSEKRLADRDTHLRLAMETGLTVAFEWDILSDRVRRLESVETALPETATDTFENVVRVVHPDDRALFRENVRAALESSDGRYRSEYRLVRPNKEVRWLHETGRVERGADGRPIRLIGIAQDVTEQRIAEEKLRRQAQLINLSHEPIVVWSPEEGIIEWNAGAERLYGFSQREALGQSIHALLHTQHQSPVEERLRALLTTGEWTGELRHTANDGRELVVDSRQQAIDLRGRRLILESCRDITARKHAEDLLRETAKRKDEFLAILAHELRNPLAPVQNAVEILRRLGLSDPRMARARDIIGRQVSHMSRLVDDLLDTSRIARGKLELRREISDLAEITRQTAGDYRASIEAAGLTLVMHGDDASAWVEGDSVRLAQMIGNLLHNAMRFTDPGGRIEVSIESEDEWISVTVSDTGIGIEPALLTRLFDPLSQADQDIARAKGGLGLGLALTKGLAELHGGRVVATSAGRGRGSSFTLTLPGHPTAHVCPSHGGASSSATTAKLRVLVIEDNADAAASLRDLLELSGHDIQVAYDGAEGVRMASAFQPDVVISDLGLPGVIDGYGVARAMRETPALRNTRLIALSGYSGPDARRRSQEAGFDEHMPKPPDIDQLEQTLLRVVVRSARSAQGLDADVTRSTRS